MQEKYTKPIPMRIRANKDQQCNFYQKYEKAEIRVCLM